MIDKKPCADKSKPNHIEISVGGLRGDACCDSQFVHMIDLVAHCCSTSGTPCIRVGLSWDSRSSRSDFRFLPECCSATSIYITEDRRGCQEPERFIRNLMDVKSEADKADKELKSLTRNKRPYAPIGFCHDNMSGGWNVSEILNDQWRFNLGGQKSSRKCCGSYPHSKAPFELEHACCNDPEDRFRSHHVIECCVQDVVYRFPAYPATHL